MTATISTGAVHHVTLTVSDVERSEAFYNVLGFNHIAEFGPVALMHNGSVILALRPPPDPAQAIDGDRFNKGCVPSLPQLIAKPVCVGLARETADLHHPTAEAGRWRSLFRDLRRRLGRICLFGGRLECR